MGSLHSTSARDERGVDQLEKAVMRLEADLERQAEIPALAVAFAHSLA